MINRIARLLEHRRTGRTCFFALVAVVLVSCAPVGGAPALTRTPMPTNILDSPTNALTPTRASSLSPPTPNAGWETFVSDDLQVAVDYPPDWSVNESAGGVTFTSPTGFSIQLAEVDTGDLPPDEFLGENQLPNTRCSTIENANGVQALVCLDTLSRSYSAYFVVTPSQGAPRLLSLSMLGKGDLQVFDWMVGSLRPSAGP